MKLLLPSRLLRLIERHGQACYPEEGAGLLLGHASGDQYTVADILPLQNSFGLEQRGRRYEIRPQDLISAEAEADHRGLLLVGVFHSHPDHPPQPSQFDLDNALPWFIYLITAVNAGQAGASRAWRLLDERDRFQEVPVISSEEEVIG